MQRHLPYAAVAVAILLTACAGPSKNTNHATPASFEPPPSSYVHLAKAGAATPTGDTIVIGVDTHSELEENDGVIALGFQLSYGLASREIQAAALETTGSGLTVDDPIRFATSDDELQDALNVTAQRNPDWSPAVSRLYRGPDRDYVMLVEFKSPAGMKPLYFDVTEWAKGFTPS